MGMSRWMGFFAIDIDSSRCMARIIVSCNFDPYRCPQNCWMHWMRIETGVQIGVPVALVYNEKMACGCTVWHECAHFRCWDALLWCMGV